MKLTKDCLFSPFGGNMKDHAAVYMLQYRFALSTLTAALLVYASSPYYIIHKSAAFLYCVLVYPFSLPLKQLSSSTLNSFNQLTIFPLVFLVFVVVRSTCWKFKVHNLIFGMQRLNIKNGMRIEVLRRSRNNLSCYESKWEIMTSKGHKESLKAIEGKIVNLTF